MFTHLALDDVRLILDKLTEVFEYNPKCSIVFSCFLGAESKTLYPEPHIAERFYGVAYLSLEELQAYCNTHHLKLEKHLDFVAMGGFVHSIFKLSRP